MCLYKSRLLNVKTFWFLTYHSLESEPRCLRQHSLECLHCVQRTKVAVESHDTTQRKPTRDTSDSLCILILACMPRLRKHLSICLPLRLSPSHDNRPREVLIYSKRICCLSCMGRGGWGIELKTRGKCNLGVTLEILFPPPSASPR